MSLITPSHHDHTLGTNLSGQHWFTINSCIDRTHIRGGKSLERDLVINGIPSNVTLWSPTLIFNQASLEAMTTTPLSPRVPKLSLVEFGIYHVTMKLTQVPSFGFEEGMHVRISFDEEDVQG